VVNEIPDWEVDDNLMIHPDATEVARAISQLSSGKAAGANGVSPELFKIESQILVEKLTTTEVFNLCHAVDPTEIPSSGGGPHGPRRTEFNVLSYSWLGQNMSY